MCMWSVNKSSRAQELTFKTALFGGRQQHTLQVWSQVDKHMRTKDSLLGLNKKDEQNYNNSTKLQE